MTDIKSRLSRRNFLLTMAVGGAAGAAAIATGSSPKEKVAAGDRRSTRGYHVTEHVLNYYRTAKV